MLHKKITVLSVSALCTIVLFVVLWRLSFSPIASFITHQITPYPIRYQKASLTGFLIIHLDQPIIQHPQASIKAAQSYHRFSIRLFPPALLIQSDLEDIRIDPLVTWIRPFFFKNGRLDLSYEWSQTVLTFTDWHSHSLNLKGKLSLDRHGNPTALDVNGTTDPAFFKSYISDEYTTFADSGSWSPYQIKWDNSSLEITLDHKTVLRSSWRMLNSPTSSQR